MSEEDRDGNRFIRHPPDYRSMKVQQFIDKLEKRLEKRVSANSSKARFIRILGSPRQAALPRNAKKWTVRPLGDVDIEEGNESESQHSEEQLLSDETD